MKWITDGKYRVFAGKTVIAQSYLGNNGYEVRILQGMPRMETVKKIFEDCPEFAKANDMDINKVPKLFVAIPVSELKHHLDYKPF